MRGFWKGLFNLRDIGGGGGIHTTGELGVMEETFKSTEPVEGRGEEGDDGTTGVVEVKDELGSRTSQTLTTVFGVRGLGIGFIKPVKGGVWLVGRVGVGSVVVWSGGGYTTPPQPLLDSRSALFSSASSGMLGGRRISCSTKT